ncbi:hypothetical protein [Micromonospora sp. NPDC093277]|uniref:hypothetical protein n=1 Tax=Micromonospora sp. NPDC093277 TaxID=3364291 RepID=UPI00382308C6
MSDEPQPARPASPSVKLSTGDVESVIRGLGDSLTSLGGVPPARSFRTPPVIARSVIERAGYVDSFPNLLGAVYTRREENLDGVAAGGHRPGPPYPEQALSDLVLLPAACYSLYPRHQGSRLADAVEYSVEGACFRQEGSDEPGRLRSFRMREFVRLGGGAECHAWRDAWLESAEAWLRELGLLPKRVVANDPFFGRAQRLLRVTQREQELKWELVVEVGPDCSQAVASCNYHKSHFGEVFEIADPTGQPAHSACAAFGYERLALALAHRHGADQRRWPASVRSMVNLGDN